MRAHDLQITPAPLDPAGGLGPVRSFQISFEYPDRLKAQAVVRDMVSKFIEGNFLAERRLGHTPASGGLTMEVLDGASLPDNPVAPNRPVIAAIGLVAGALLGTVLAWRRRLAAHPQPARPEPRPHHWKYALTAAAIGAVAAGLGSLAIPSRYVSTATLRLSIPEGQSADARVQDVIRQLSSRDILSAVIERPSIQLYQRERSHHSIDDVIKQMRDRDLRIAPQAAPSPEARTATLTISFEYPDRQKAHLGVQGLVSSLVEKHDGDYAEVCRPQLQ